MEIDGGSREERERESKGGERVNRGLDSTLIAGLIGQKRGRETMGLKRYGIVMGCFPMLGR